MKNRYFILTILLLLTHFSYAQVIEKSYVTTDREIYTQNDTLWFKGYVFNQYNLLSDQSIAFHVILSDQSGNKISTTSWPIVNAMAHGNLSLTLGEGKYYLHAYSGQMAGSSIEQAFRKEIHVRSTQADEVSLKRVSDRPVYKPSEKLSIDISAQSGTVLEENLRLDYEVWDNNQLIKTGRAKTNDQGIAEVELEKITPLGKNFHLLLKADKSGVKTSQLTIPIALGDPEIDLQFFPEGGSLISTLKNNVAFKAIDKQGLPIAIKGRLIDQSGATLASTESYYKGMGQFKLSPAPDQEYFFQIDEPEGIDSIYKLPTAYNSGTIISVDSVDVSDVLSVLFQSTSDLQGQKATFQLKKNDQVIGEFGFGLKQQQIVQLPLEKLSIGVYTLKVVNEALTHQSERLFFVKPREQLNISIQTNKAAYKAREKVEGQLSVKDSKGNPIAGDFSIAAIYKTRSLIPNSEQPNLMAQILLKSDLRGHIPTPNFYFSQDEKAIQALNLVMLTNGWRRYSPSNLPDPEAIVGRVYVKRKKDQPFPDAAINLLTIKTDELQSFDLDEKGGFNISATQFKERGDSLLIFVNTESKKLAPNIALNQDYKNVNATFQKSLLDSTTSSIRHDIYLPAFKIVEGKFQGVTMLNSAEVTTSRQYFRNGCTMLESDPEGWVTKTVDQLDMTNPEIIRLLKQVSPLVEGYGKVIPENLSRQSYSTPNGRIDLSWIGRFQLATNAILSTQKVRSEYFITQVKVVNYEVPLPYELCINCECAQIPFAAKDLNLSFKQLLSLRFNTSEPYYQYIEPYNVDFANIESVSIRDFEIRPIILIKTKDQIVNRKVYINRHLYIVTYKNSPDEFYRPVYETKGQIEDVAPDTRDILFWQHSLMTGENGETKFSFYNADRPQIIQISVEGIAANGQLGVATQEYIMLDEKITYEK